MIKPFLRTTVKKDGCPIYEFSYSFSDGRCALARIFFVAGTLQYRYLVQAPDGTESEYHTPYTHQKLLASWNEQPESERGPRPACILESDLCMYLGFLSDLRRMMISVFHIGLPHETPKQIDVPTGPSSLESIPSE